MGEPNIKLGKVFLGIIQEPKGKKKKEKKKQNMLVLNRHYYRQSCWQDPKYNLL